MHGAEKQMEGCLFFIVLWAPNSQGTRFAGRLQAASNQFAKFASGGNINVTVTQRGRRCAKGLDRMALCQV